MAAPMLSEPDPERREFAFGMQLLNRPEQQQACEDIARLIEEVRRCQTPADYRQVQQRLGAHIEQIDAAVGKAKKQLVRTENRLRSVELGSGGRGSVEATHLKEELEQHAFDRKLFLTIGRQYRMVGDAMAWQLYGFQTLPIFALGMNESPGNSNTKAGAGVEAEEVERIWRDRGAFALRHDFTTCLRIWDLSVFDPGRPTAPQIVEVKRKQRTKGHQKTQGRIITQLVNHHLCSRQDGRVLLHGPQPTSKSDGVLPTNLGLLLHAVEESRVEGLGFAANDYLAVIALNLPLLKFRLLTPPPPEKFLRPWVVPEEIVTPLCSHYISGNSYDRMMRANFDVPYGVYPLFSSAAARLITGYVRVYYHLNLEAIVPAFEAAGFETRCLLDEHPASRGFEVNIGTPFFRLRRGSISITLSGLPIGQVLFEGLRIEDLVASTVALYKAMEARGGIVLPSGIYCNPRSLDALSTYTNMEAIWRISRGYLLEAGE